MRRCSPAPDPRSGARGNPAPDPRPGARGNGAPGVSGTLTGGLRQMVPDGRRAVAVAGTPTRAIGGHALAEVRRPT